MIVADYDELCDVLYVALDRPRAAYGDEQPDGLLFRYAYEGDRPCGVTIFSFQESWGERKQELAKRIAEFLGANDQDVIAAFQQAMHLA